MPLRGERRKPWVFEFAWIGAAGILLFVVLRFPIAAFYRKLGTTPEEVGLDYTLILTQSSPAVVVLLIMCAIWYWVLSKMADDPRMTTISNELSQFPRPDMRREVLRSLNDDAFERRMQEAQEYWSHTERDRKIFETESPVFRELRTLDRTSKLYRFPLATLELRRSFYGDIPEAERKRKHRHGSAWMFGCLVLFFFGYIFPGVAGVIGENVRDCGGGVSLLGLELNGQPVQLLDTTGATQRFADRELLLLGGDSSRYILYDCKNHNTLRVPIAGSVFVSPP